MPAYNTLSIGGATTDLFVRTGRDLTGVVDGVPAIALPLGEKIRVEEVVEKSGGGACNSSVGLKRLGCDASFLGILGDDAWGQKILKDLKSEGVHIDTATIVEGERTSFSVILSAKSGERVILYDSATNKHLSDPTFHRAAAAESDWIYLNSLTEEAAEIENDLHAIFATRPRPGLTWNPGGTQIRRGIRDASLRHLLTHATILLLNKDEAAFFTGEKDTVSALRVLSKLGPEWICVTDGANGATATDGKNLYQTGAMNGLIVDTTGAGDAFGVAVTFAKMQGFSLPIAIRAGTINSASVIAAVGAQTGLLREKDLRKKLEFPAPAVTERPL